MAWRYLAAVLLCALRASTVQAAVQGAQAVVQDSQQFLQALNNPSVTSIYLRSSLKCVFRCSFMHLQLDKQHPIEKRAYLTRA